MSDPRQTLLRTWLFGPGADRAAHDAMQASSAALPSVVPITVISAARVPRVAPVAITSVTIGPGTITRTKVMRRKAEKRW